MALTDFGNLTTNKKIAWSRELWRQARNNSFIMKFAGEGPTSCIQRVTELTKDEKGDKAIITLVPELTGKGVMGDAQLTGKEEGANSYDFAIPIDQHRMGMKSKGRLAEQQTIVNFRKTAKDLLGYRFGTQMDLIGFNIAAGIHPDVVPGGLYTETGVAGDDLVDLAFGAAFSAPTSKRKAVMRAAGIAFGADGVTASATASDAVTRLNYGAILDLKAGAIDRYIKPAIHPELGETYYLMVSPTVMAYLKRDGDILANIRNNWNRGKDSPLFVGADSLYVDGVVIMQHRYIPTNVNATSATAIQAPGTGAGRVGLSKFNNGTNATAAGLTLTGTRCLFMGAQALAMADLGAPSWDESDVNDYGNQPGVGIGKLYGLAKPFFKGSHDDAAVNQDFGVVTVDVLN